MKRNIHRNKEELSPSDIQKGKNFNDLLKKMPTNTPVSGKPWYKNTWFGGGVAIAILAVVTGIVLSDKPAEEIPVVEEVAAFINPPIKGIDVPKETYNIDANNGGVVNHFTGTKITIPANAFVTKDGKPVSGEVEIQYREFHDQADIYFSGIPMAYDSAGEKSVFESAGMMEVRAFQNGERLEMAPNKNFVVCMHTKNPDEKFNLYYLEEEKKNWIYKGKDTVKIEERGEVEVQEPIQSLTITEKAVLEQEKVVTLVSKELEKLKQTSLVKPTKASEEKYSFNIDVKKEEFPEITAYNGTIFEAIDQKNFDSKVYSIAWESIELNKVKEATYNVRLKKGNQEKEILVKPVFEGADYTKALADFEKKDALYQKNLKEKLVKQKEEETLLAEKRKAYEEAVKQQKLRQEMASNKEDLLAENDRIMTRVFRINKLGTWNCDSPVKPPQGQQIIASFKDTEGKTIDAIALRLIQKEQNAVFPVAISFPFDKGRRNVLWGTTKDGEIILVGEEQFAAIKQGDYKVDFIPRIIDPLGKDLAEVKKLMGV